jgi:FixJ family two-component response regulator
MPHSRSRIVYVVDDDNDVRESTIALLKAAGMAARAYASGDTFLKNLEAADRGCILLDLHMPGLSGFQVLESLRKSGNKMPVILFSGRADPTTDEIAMQSGAAAVLPKPFSPAQLIETVRHLLPDDQAA